MHAPTTTFSILDLGPHLIGFYDGRAGNARYFSQQLNWLDDGGFALGICSYAVVDGSDAVVYDTHLSCDHAAYIRAELARRGVKNFRVVLSHWHLDHVAGSAVFADCEIIACSETARILARSKQAIEAGTLEGPPGIAPLILPTTTFDGGLELTCGRIGLELRQFDIHSSDGVAMAMPHENVVLAGDILEDTVTYVAEPDRLEQHLHSLSPFTRWCKGRHLLLNHGARERLARGGYDDRLVEATRFYLEALLAAAKGGDAAMPALSSLVERYLSDGSIHYFAAYEDVHRANFEKVSAAVRRGLQGASL